jgi:integrase
MGRKAEELGPLKVSHIKTPGFHAVGGVSGLYLQVLPTGGRCWVLRVMIGGKRRDMGLGGFPDVPLADARRKAREAREAIEKGRDPIEERKAAKAALAAGAGRVLTFEQAVKDYLRAHEGAWKNPKHLAAWKHTLDTYANPAIGKLAVGDIETTHILNLLRPIWSEKTETAKRLRGRIEQILNAAKATGAIKSPWENPARWRGHLDRLLAPPRKLAPVVHHKALPVDEAGAFMVRLRQVEGMGARALAFAILTAARSGEVRGATWAEIDLKAKIWTVPKQRMKANREHRVPLSAAAIELLESLPRLARCDLVFPAASGRPLSDMTLSAVCRRMDVAAVPHGFRSTFRDWCGEHTSFPREIAEAALAHTIGDEVEAAYRRGDALEKRRRLMDSWAAFLAKPAAAKGDNVRRIREPV